MFSSKEELAVTKGGTGISSSFKAVANAVAGIERGSPFSVGGFNELGLSSAEVSKAIFKLLRAGELKRAVRGFYFRPSGRLAYLGLEVFPSPSEIAKSWASERGYVLVDQGAEEAYRLRFQTQMPMANVFWTDGPSREFRVGNAVALVKRKADSRLLWPGEPIGRLYRALLVVPVSDRASARFRKALSQCFGDRASTINGLDKLAEQAALKKWLCLITQERDRLLNS